MRLARVTFSANSAKDWGVYEAYQGYVFSQQCERSGCVGGLPVLRLQPTVQKIGVCRRLTRVTFSANSVKDRGVYEACQGYVFSQQCKRLGCV